MHYAILLFPGFEALDAFGPLEILNVLAEQTPIHLSILSTTLSPVSTRSPDPAAHRHGSICAQSILPTATLADFLSPPSTSSTQSSQAATVAAAAAAAFATDREGAAAATTPIDVLLVPGGAGTRFPDIMAPYIDFIRAIYPSLQYVLSVCNGSGVVARAGVLDGRRATTNKMLWEATTALRPQVDWVREARWVVDGNVWTSSGVSAGIDAMLAFVRAVYGREMARRAAREIEFVWDEEEDGTRDAFA